MAEDPIPVDAEFTLLRPRSLGQRRASPRYRCPPATLCLLTFPDTGKSLQGWVHNLSAGGIGLSLLRPLAPGTPLTIRLRTTTSERPVQLAAEVVHATPQLDGLWRVGCKLAERLGPEALEALL